MSPFADPAVAVIAALLFGLAIGSFLNVVIHRLPKMMEREWMRECTALRGEEVPELPAFNLAKPRSHCPSCNHAITALENGTRIVNLLTRPV